MSETNPVGTFEGFHNPIYFTVLNICGFCPPSSKLLCLSFVIVRATSPCAVICLILSLTVWLTKFRKEKQIGLQKPKQKMYITDRNTGSCGN